DLVLLALGHDVDRGAVERGADLAGVEGAVVVGVVPGQTALVAGVLPEGLQELHGLDRALRVDRHLLAAGVDLGSPEVPQERIDERRRIPEVGARRWADRLPLGLELFAAAAFLAPRLGNLFRTDLVNPRPPVRDRVADDGVRHGQPLAV